MVFPGVGGSLLHIHVYFWENHPATGSEFHLHPRGAGINASTLLRGTWPGADQLATPSSLRKEYHPLHEVFFGCIRGFMREVSFCGSFSWRRFAASIEPNFSLELVRRICGRTSSQRPPCRWSRCFCLAACRIATICADICRHHCHASAKCACLFIFWPHNLFFFLCKLSAYVHWHSYVHLFEPLLYTLKRYTLVKVLLQSM